MVQNYMDGIINSNQIVCTGFGINHARCNADNSLLLFVLQISNLSPNYSVY
jgi:hypothetical protein